MPRNITLNLVLETAAQLVEANGLENLNLNILAKELVIKPPSLYNHINGITELQQELSLLVLERVADAIQRSAVGRSEESALREVALSYRRFAGDHPELYKLFVHSPGLSGKQALESVAEILRRILSVYGLSESDETNFIRMFHSAMHGFVSLENAGFFSAQADIADSYNILIDNQIFILNNMRGNTR